VFHKIEFRYSRKIQKMYFGNVRRMTLQLSRCRTFVADNNAPKLGMHVFPWTRYPPTTTMPQEPFASSGQQLSHPCKITPLLQLSALRPPPTSTRADRSCTMPHSTSLKATSCVPAPGPSNQAHRSQQRDHPSSHLPQRWTHAKSRFCVF